MYRYHNWCHSCSARFDTLKLYILHRHNILPYICRLIVRYSLKSYLPFEAKYWTSWIQRFGNFFIAHFIQSLIFDTNEKKFWHTGDFDSRRILLVSPLFVYKLEDLFLPKNIRKLLIRRIYFRPCKLHYRKKIYGTPKEVALLKCTGTLKMLN